MLDPVVKASGGEAVIGKCCRRRQPKQAAGIAVFDDASILTDRDVDDASLAGPLLDLLTYPVELFMSDGGYDRINVYTTLYERLPAETVVVPPRVDAVLSATATSRRSPGKGDWSVRSTVATMKKPALRASSRAGSRSSVMGCVSTATRPGPLKSPSLPRSSTDARPPELRPRRMISRGGWVLLCIFLLRATR
jgi:hypothetical protein